VCSGIEAATVAWHPLGWTPAWFAEIEPFPSAVLEQRWPGVPNVGDFTRIKRDSVEPIELLVGGTPCQSFSVAGKRGGLDDPRGNLTLEFLALAGRLRPRWVCYENVPGLLSDDGGRTFGTVLGLLGQLGYGFAYRVLDAQFFGVPQRRRRVFVVGCLGSWQRAAAVLLEPSCLSGNPPPRREAGQGIAASLTHGVDSGGKGGYAGRRREDDVNLAYTLLGREGKGPDSGNPYGDHESREGLLVAHSLRADGFDASEDGTGRGTPLVFDERNITSKANRTRVEHGAPCGTLHATPFTLASRGRGDSHDLEWRRDGTANALLQPNGGRAGIGVGAVAFHNRQDPDSGPVTHPVGAKDNGLGVLSAMTVRRLTPLETERLQGLPDHYTAITYKGKPAADGPRYRAIGNSFAVPVVAWIGRRIQLCEATA
jgi:DNA (cytosine-5)-methyltransferase 1